MAMQINQLLTQHFEQIKPINIKGLFAQNSNRAKSFSLNFEGLFLDYSKNHINEETLHLLSQYADECQLKKATNDMFAGEKINRSEQRSVLHTALRDPREKSQIIDGHNITIDIKSSLAKMQRVCESISNSNFTDVVNIGIGGSDLGPHMLTHALKKHPENNLNYHYIANLDPSELNELFSKLNPNTTLFIVVSKSFSTSETLTNAERARQWLQTNLSNKEDLFAHFIAVTANVEKASELGLPKEQIIPIWDWVGGRFSISSAVSLSSASSIGMNHFEDFLAGSHAMDQHFQNAPLNENMPVIMALINFWNNNYLGYHHSAVIPYSQRLSLFPEYLKQLSLESNGKYVDVNGQVVNYMTAPLITGGVGSISQHSLSQFLMQGTHIVPTDFILIKNVPQDQILQRKLNANAFAQMRALSFGNIDEDNPEGMPAHKRIIGNVPNNCLVLDELTPFNLGALIALYEHKTFVEGVLWNINSFDQWGVELGKVLAKDIFKKLREPELALDYDSSTNQLINLFRN